MSAKNRVYVVTKNGNFVQAVASKNKVVKLLRNLIANDLRFKNIDKIPVEEKDDVLCLAGTPYYRAKHVVIQ